MKTELAYPMVVAARDTVHGRKKDANKVCQIGEFLTLKVCCILIAESGYVVTFLLSPLHKLTADLVALIMHKRPPNVLHGCKED